MRRLPSYIDEQSGIVFTPEQYTAASRNNGRIRIFLSVFVLCLLVSLSYTLLRPAIYESKASLLVTPPPTDERLSDISNAQHVELELQYLAGHSLLAMMQEMLSVVEGRDDVAGLTLTDLDEMLEAVPVANTNLVELIARGPGKQQLPVVINAWVRAYQETHEGTIAAESESSIVETEQLLDELRQKVTEKRRELDQFRKSNDIVSMERNENNMLKQLSDLTDSLNRAKAEELAAKARISAIKKAVAEGRPVVSDSGQGELVNLEQQLVMIEKELKELAQEFTPHYMSIDPRIKRLVRNRDSLREEIDEKQATGQRRVLAKAEQDLANAQRALRSLPARRDEQKQQVMEFTTRFAEHEALQQELLQLEAVYRDVQNRQLQNQVNLKRQYPQVRVKEPAFLPERPVYPDYFRDSGISVAASLLLGLLALVLYDFLNRPGRHPNIPQLNPVVVNVPGAPALEQVRSDQLAAAQVAPALANQMRRELSVSEVLTLLQAADSKSRLLITLLLSGVSDEEVSAMQAGDINLSASELEVQGGQQRKIVMSPATASVISDALSACITGHPAGTPPADSLVCSDANGDALSPSDLDAMMACAAHDAGLANPAEITTRSLRHTYIAYLVRQGVRLSELKYIAGDMPPAVLAGYTTFSPPGSGMSLDLVDRTYPALVMQA
jgi:succinoglycan biosynthesis transport protein ExoP